jgi:hypothetical protein
VILKRGSVLLPPTTDGTPESVKAEFGITDDFSMEEKIATLKAYPFLRKGCDDIPEMKEANEMLKRQEEEAKRGAAPL